MVLGHFGRFGLLPAHFTGTSETQDQEDAGLGAQDLGCPRAPCLSQVAQIRTSLRPWRRTRTGPGKTLWETETPRPGWPPRRRPRVLAAVAGSQPPALPLGPICSLLAAPGSDRQIRVWSHLPWVVAEFQQHGLDKGPSSGLAHRGFRGCWGRRTHWEGLLKPKPRKFKKKQNLTAFPCSCWWLRARAVRAWSKREVSSLTPRRL